MYCTACMFAFGVPCLNVHSILFSSYFHFIHLKKKKNSLSLCPPVYLLCLNEGLSNRVVPDGHNGDGVYVCA